MAESRFGTRHSKRPRNQQFPCIIGVFYNSCMSEDKSSRWPHVLGVAGFFLSLAGLAWQVFVYKDSLAEKALVRLSSYQAYVSRSVPPLPLPFRKGDLHAEVVNIGRHPLYVKTLRLTAPCPWAENRSAVRDFVPDNTKAGTPLQSGAAATYHANDWDFSAHPLDSPDDPAKKEIYCITVESNKGVVAQSLSPGISHAYSITVIEGGKR